MLSSRKQKAAERFRRQIRFLIHNFDLNKLVISTVANIRLLTIHHWTFKELKLVKKQNLNKMTHSYTTQYSITASGKLLPRVFLCLQEPTNKFGPRVLNTAKKLEAELKNVVVTYSKSDKLTKDLYKPFLQSSYHT